MICVHLQLASNSCIVFVSSNHYQDKGASRERHHNYPPIDNDALHYYGPKSNAIPAARVTKVVQSTMLKPMQSITPRQMWIECVSWQ
mmetsp:Transcript_875/g.1527  ORF Transcript_875/g.1527 Transcript_875/m.1527 type:complete len:87 (+) Transcript_875:32-292(+)